ncbi:MAG: prolyl oligopeptidase family serine peptidase [Flavobacteriales bacterium]
MKSTFLFTLLLLAPCAIFGQLQLSEIMKGPGFVGALPENPTWSLDGKKVLYQKKFSDSASVSYFLLEPIKGTSAWISEKKAADFVSFDPLQARFEQQICYQNNNLFSVDKKTGKRKTYFEGIAGLSSVQRQANDQLVAFELEGQWLQLDLNTGSLTQLTNISTKKAPQQPAATTLENEQLALFEYLQKPKPIKAPDQTIYLGFDPARMQLDPSGNFVLALRHNDAQEQLTEVTKYITKSGYTESFKARAKVGQEDPDAALFLLDLNKKKIQKLDFSKLSTMSFGRKLFIHEAIFAYSKPHALIDIRSADNKDRWIVLLSLSGGQITELVHQHDDAWIGGPGISSWNMEAGVLGWLEDGATFYFQSEETGYSHLYLFDLNSKKISALTTGNFEVHGVQLSNDHSKFFLTCNKTHPGNRDFWELDIRTKMLKPILTKDGFHEVQLAPNESDLLVRYSYTNRPWELYFAKCQTNTTLKQLTTSCTAAFNAYHWIDPKIIAISTSDNVPVYARLYEPVPSLKNGAAVCFVHGAGYLQNAHKGWSHYYREYMFHHLLLERGYTVIDVDYRASEGYGRNYRTAIYRHMGGRDLADYLDAKKYLVDQLGIDAKRVGIYGGSYGGFLTLMALFTQPGEFACGAALRSVTDWAHYNHEYTSNILNDPQTDPEAYKQSSPIYFAEGLQDPLLMLHGMVDDNVQFQDIIRLNQRLIELGKTDWNLAVYPVESHGFTEPSSWTDEYRRILELFETHLK